MTFPTYLLVLKGVRPSGIYMYRITFNFQDRQQCDPDRSSLVKYASIYEQ